ncbi:hypothetical protein U1Q18_038003 [Sarracenia purpurea var. burkii]
MEINGEVEVKRMLHFGSLNNVMMSVFGRSCSFDENEEHIVKRAQNGGVGADEGSGDFVDILLDIEKENKLSDLDMIAVLLVFSLIIYSVLRDNCS